MRRALSRVRGHARSRRSCSRSMARPTRARSPTRLAGRESEAMNPTDAQALRDAGGEAGEIILASIDRFLEREVKPYAQRLEHDDVYPADIVTRMQELGLFGATIAADYGG